MIDGMEKEQCSGCGACYGACPSGAISMAPDSEGFFYPEINDSKCIGCDKCVRVCPVLNIGKKSDKIPDAIVCASTDSRIRQQSTSGGFFAELARFVLEQQGVVFGVEYDENYLPRHCVIEQEEELHKLCRSKYIQSNVFEVYKIAEIYLQTHRLVLFSGTACQIAGLKQYLRKDYDGLITCDVVCRGVMSPQIWRKHLDELEERYKSKISYVGFREKGKSFHKSRMVIRFKNGKIYAPSTNVEWISRFFADGLNLRPSCYRCRFKGYDRVSDFTMYDCWNLSRLVENVTDDDKGYTNVLLHTEKAKRFFEKIKSALVWWPVDAEKARKYDGVMLVETVKEPEKREAFFADANALSISQLGKKYTPLPPKVVIKESVKKILRRIHLLET